METQGDTVQPAWTRIDFAERFEAGRTARKALARQDQAAFETPDRDPVAILEAQHADRLAHLIPVRVGRMLQSPFTFYRGSAAIMAADLREAPTTGQSIVICGDAHISNFGLFATPERNLTFELNDFDEVSAGPWEWDVKRLAASIVLGGSELGLDDATAADAAVTAVSEYRDALSRLGEMSVLDRFYYRGHAAWEAKKLDDETRALVQKTVKKARQRTSDQLIDRIVTADEHGTPRIIDQPPVMEHSEYARMAMGQALIRDYLLTVRADIALLLRQFTLTDVVLRVVGVGSVGTRCYIMLLTGSSGEPLFLQAKEAPPSVLSTWGGQPNFLADLVPPDRYSEGFRVVTGQRIMQSASDPFLGHFRHSGRDFYVRQFRDMKGGFELERMTRPQFRRYVVLCAALLARAHAQSPHAAFIMGYLGRGTAFPQAMGRWGEAYAAQAIADRAALAAAVASGRVSAEYGV